MGSRIVFDPEPDADEKLECWKIYNIITGIYKPHPNRTRDWLSNPKATGYEALHVTVMGPEGYWIEVQIRSRRMDDIAEKGLAAHWNYKKDYTSSENKIEEWLNAVNELLKSPDSNAMQLFESFKISQYESEFFVFTPKGDIKSVPAHSTVLDFAFKIHTDIGCHAIGAKVNNKIVPLNYELHSGDQVEILTSEKQTPKKEWLDFVTGSRIKDKICGILKIGHHKTAGDVRHRDTPFAASFDIKGIDRSRLLLDIVSAISNTSHANIDSVEMTTDDGIFCANIKVYVSASSGLKSIYDSLSNISGIESVTRIDL